MNARPLTDAQIARALRAHLPEHAQAGLRDRILDQAASTAQQRTLPSFLAGLSDADPVSRRRYQLLAATLLVALTLAVAAGVGAFLDLQKPAPFLSLEPPTDVDAYVVGAYEGIAELPALSITIVEEEGTKSRFIYNGAGILRLDHFDMATATEPAMFRLYRDGVMAEEADMNGERVWLEYTGQPPALFEIVAATGSQGTCSGGSWDYVGLEYLIGRPAHHVECGGDSLWLDIETGIPLKSINDQEGPDFPTIRFTVIELVVGPQPPELFVPPPGLAVLDDLAYNCAIDPACKTPPTPRPAATPVASPPPALGEHTAPADVDAFVAEVVAGYSALPALEMTVTYPYGGPGATNRYLYDGSGRFRLERTYDPSQPPVVELFDDGHWYEGYGTTEDGRTIWKDWGPSDRTGVLSFGLGVECRAGWEHKGFDTVLERPAHHLVCGYLEIWVDREWLLVTRGQQNPDPFGVEPYVYLVLELNFAQAPPELFELPEDAVVCPGGVRDGACVDSSGNPMPLPSTTAAFIPSG